MFVTPASPMAGMQLQGGARHIPPEPSDIQWVAGTAGTPLSASRTRGLGNGNNAADADDQVMAPTCAMRSYLDSMRLAE